MNVGRKRIAHDQDDVGSPNRALCRAGKRQAQAGQKEQGEANRRKGIVHGDLLLHVPRATKSWAEITNRKSGFRGGGGRECGGNEQTGCHRNSTQRDAGRPAVAAQLPIACLFLRQASRTCPPARRRANTPGNRSRPNLVYQKDKRLGLERADFFATVVTVSHGAR
jgi:hypothetical protein